MAQKKQEPEVRIKFADGSTRKIILTEVNEKPQEFLEKKTGLIYGQGDFYSQTIGILYSWICKHGPDDKFSQEVVAAAEMVIMRGLSEMTGGYAALDDENEEFLVYVPSSKGDYVILISKLMDKIIKEGEFSYVDEVLSVTKVGKKISVDELREQLKAALEVENYELAAKLRDRLKKKKK